MTQADVQPSLTVNDGAPLDGGAGVCGAVAPRAIPLWVSLSFAAAVIAAFCFSLDFAALAEPDEPRYAEIAREMLVRGDFITPTLNYVKYFEKPPLVYWLTALTFRLVGVSDWVARLVPLAAAFGTLALTWVFGRHAYDRWVAAVGTAVLATSPLFFAMGQTLTLDLPLTLCLTAALVCFWFGYHNQRYRRALYLALYVCVGLGVLTKGPVAALLTAAVIGGFLVIRRDWRALGPVIDRRGIMAFLVLTLPWFVIVSVRNPEFVNFFIVNQHLKRFLAPEEHQQGIWFFVPIVFAALIPWSVALAMTPAWWGVCRRPRSWSPATWFCVLWAVVVVGFFSLSASKLVTYILPALPPLALLTARALQVVLDAGAPLRPRLAAYFLILGVAMIVGGTIARVLQVDPVVPRILPALYGGGVLMVATGAVLRRLRDPHRALAAAMCGALGLLVVAIAARGVTESYRELGRVIQQQAGPADQVVIYRHYVQGIAWYTGRRAVLVGARGELAFGSEQGDQRAYFWRDEQRLLDAWGGPTRLFLVINRVELAALRPQLSLPPIEIAAHGKKVVVINHPL